MTSKDEQTANSGSTARASLSPAAERALAEAEARRRQAHAQKAEREIGGRKGPDPARYGDWEVKGIATDF